MNYALFKQVSLLFLPQSHKGKGRTWCFKAQRDHTTNSYCWIFGTDVPPIIKSRLSVLFFTTKAQRKIDAHSVLRHKEIQHYISVYLGTILPMSYCLSAVAGVISPWLIVSKYDEAKSLGLTENLGIKGTDVPPRYKVFVPCSLFFVPYSIPSQTIPSNYPQLQRVSMLHWPCVWRVADVSFHRSWCESARRWMFEKCTLLWFCLGWCASESN
jgi:hypothetical protein